MTQHRDKQIGLQLRRLRIQLYGEMGSLGSVAREAGLSIVLLGAIERGEHGLWELSEDEMTRLAQAFRLSPEQFTEAVGVPAEELVQQANAERRSPPPTLSANLQQAVEDYAQRPRYAGLETLGWITYLSGLQFEDGIDPPPAVWAEIFLTLKQSGVVPRAK